MRFVSVNFLGNQTESKQYPLATFNGNDVTLDDDQPSMIYSFETGRPKAFAFTILGLAAGGGAFSFKNGAT